jgi:DNA sulfur modification protein DndD
MIIRSVEFEDFGVYGGHHTFELTPQSSDQFSRPVILFSAKNGTGKTTFVEGLRLCLHGSLALGDRVSRAAYERHLARRIHRPFKEGIEKPSSARVVMEFDFVRNGEPHFYKVERRWHRTETSVSEQVSILEDGDSPEGLHEEQKDSFLRELIPSSAADLFFFDGEKIDKLADEEQGTEILASSVKALLGLHLVDRLEDDLDVYVSRHVGTTNTGAGEELDEVKSELQALRDRRDGLEEAHRENREALESKQAAITAQRQRVKSEGGDYAERRNTLEKRRQELDQAIDTQQKSIQQLADGIVPFAAAPGMCRKVRDRLALEAQYQQWQTSQALIDEQLRLFADQLQHPSFWEATELERTEKLEEQLLDQLTATLKRSNPADPVDEDEVIIHASERERGKLDSWLDEALGATTKRFHEAVQQLIDLKEEAGDIDAELERVPQDLILQPLVETLNQLEAEYVALQNKAEEIADEIGTVEFKLEQAEHKFEKVKERVEREQQQNQQIQLAFKTQRALRSYAARLKKRKLAALEEALHSGFNKLCRKETLLDGVSIEPKTFNVTLQRGAETFLRHELSAGEQQLFAIATIWGLRQVSDVPIPVVIDTPLGRLDKDHRKTMLESYIPQASHQVMLLATDAEVNEHIMGSLDKTLSHAYKLHFDDASARTVVESFDPTSARQHMFDEVPA